MNDFSAAACGFLAVLFAGTACAQDSSPASYDEGLYAALLGSYVNPDNGRQIDDGFGGALGLGYRMPGMALELSGEYVPLNAQLDGKHAEMLATMFSALIYPFDFARGFYFTLGAGYVDTRDQRSGSAFDGAAFEGGAGYLLKLQTGSYEWGLRADIRQRLNQHGNDTDSRSDPKSYSDTFVRFGLQLPFGARPPEPVAMAAAQVQLADADDDHVADADDQCPGTPAGTTVDARGCPGAPPPPPECKAPQPGQRITLDGCAAGDVIVLRGVNFRSDDARLTANAAAILDDVAIELLHHGKIHVEIGGHTDARGRDAYNQKLSEARAESVRQYLIGRGVAPHTMEARGYGETMPVADNDSAPGREQNRRVELKIESDSGETSTDAPSTPAAEGSEAPPMTAIP